MAHGHQSGRRSTLGAGSGLAQTVRTRLNDDPAWQHVARNGTWICPYCLSTVRGADTTRAALGRAIESHLDRRCTGWQGGRGQAKSAQQITARLAHEEISHLATSDPAWQVFDHEGYWYSPCSLQKVHSVRLAQGRFDSFTVQNMVAHLAGCEHYRAGRIHDVAAVQRARDATVRAGQLTANVRQLIEYPLWRYVDDSRHWICPFCVAVVAQVPLASAVDWELAPDRMAWHLAAECPTYVPERPETRGEGELARIPGATVATPVEGGGSDPTRSGGLRIARSGSHAVSGVRTPIRGSVYRTPRPETGPTPGQRPAVTGPAPGTARIATPLPGMRQATPPLPPAEAAPRQQTPAPPTTSRVAKPVPRSSDTPAAGELLNGTIFDAFDTTPRTTTKVTAKTGEGGSFSWMDEVEEKSQQREATVDDDRAKARDVQVGLLGKLPEIPGYRFATRFEACHDVSGDFYDFISLADGRLGIAQGDVSGHGIQAGLIMSMAKKTLSIYAASGGSPAATLAQVNDSLADDLGGRTFVSMAYGILDPGMASITWVRAGHNPIVRYNLHTGEIDEIKPRGMVVGMKKGPIFQNSLQEETIQVRPGDTFLVYTDGINETMNRQNVEYGTELLFEVIQRYAAEGPEVLLDRIMDSIRQFRGGSTASDDATLLAFSVD